jgi:hypothetical protein
VGNAPPQNVSAGSDVNVGEGTPVLLSGSFSDPGSADTHVRRWSVVASNGQAIPDGSAATFGFTPVDNGTYTVTLTVTDDDGGATSDVVLVQVTNVAPQNVSAGPDRGVPEGSPVSLSAAFTDPGAVDTHTIQWSVTASNGDSVPAGSGSTFSFTPADNGTYTVQLRVTDKDGGTQTDTAVVTATNVAPQNLSIGPDRAVNEGASVLVEASLADPGTRDTHTYQWRATGPGGQTVATDNQPKFLFVPPDNGAYNVSVTVTDKDGGVAMDSLVVTAANVAPRIDLGADRAAIEGTLVTINAAASAADDGSADVLTLAWQVFSAGGQLVASAAGPMLSFTPADNGTYTVLATVSDDDGASTADSLLVSVSNAAPTSLVLSGESMLGIGGVLHLAGSWNDVAADTWRVRVDYGDGAVLQVPNTGTSFASTHVYGQTGQFQVTVTVTDDDGGQVIATRPVTVTSVTGPVVQEVRWKSTRWTPAFTAALGGGYATPSGAGQLTTMPWDNIDQVAVRFDRAVVVTAADLALAGVNVPD